MVTNLAISPIYNVCVQTLVTLEQFERWLQIHLLRNRWQKVAIVGNTA